MTENSFETVRPYLLPNEDVEFICRILGGFIVLSRRRFVLLKEKKNDVYSIEKAIPYSCISGIEQKKIDRFEVSGFVLDQYGRHTRETKFFLVRAPREEKEGFQSTLNQCIDVLQEMKNSDSKAAHYDNSYLDSMPESLTRNARLDLNTILRDQPIPDTLVQEAEEFLSTKPFIIEESLRAANDKENGILFAVGKRGYYWIQGMKIGRFMSNVIIDTVEWSNIQSISYRWNDENAIIDVTYSLTSNGKSSTTQYQWSPSANNETIQYPWLLQCMNGPWILADIISKHSELTCSTIQY